MPEIVITGYGVVSPIGIGRAEFEAAQAAGPVLNGPTAAVPEFDPREHLGKKGLRAMSRAVLLLATAAKLALDDAGFTVDDANAQSLGLVAGTMFGSVNAITAFDWSALTDGPKYVNPMHFPNTVINAPSGHVGIKSGMKGVNSTISAGLASGLIALDYAANLVREGRLTAVVAGGLEELCEESRLAVGHSFSPHVLSEGAALLVLEAGESAAAAGKAPLARIRGFGSAHPGREMGTIAGGTKAAVSAIRAALDSAAISASDVDVIVSSANGDSVVDEIDANAITEAVDSAIGAIPRIQPKRNLGETMGAGGAFAALMGMSALVPGSSDGAGRNALVAAFDPQGPCAAMVFSTPDSRNVNA